MDRVKSLLTLIVHGTTAIAFESHFAHLFRFAMSASTLIAMALSTTPTVGQTPQQPAHAAQPAARNQAFEAASIRLEDPRHPAARPLGPDLSLAVPNNRFRISHTTLKGLIYGAYGVDRNNVLGGPAWLDSQYYDLNAKVEGNAQLTYVQMQPLVRTLLEERFHLVVHHVPKVVSGYALVVAKGGPRIKPTTGAAYFSATRDDGLRMQNASLENAAKMLTVWCVKQPIVDKTGLTGQYDFDLKFSPENTPADSPYVNLPSIYTALQEQLGLKLLPQKVQIGTIVIDHVDRIPTEN